MNPQRKKLHLFSRGSFQILTILLFFSPLFTRMFRENVLLYVMFSLIILFFDFIIEYILIKKRGSHPKSYMAFFQAICMPVNVFLLCLFYCAS